LTDRLLRSNASLECIRKQIEAHTVIREKVPTSHDLPLSNVCQRVIAYAAEEAEMLFDKHIGTEHLLLGVLREQESFAAQLLNERGVLLATTRSLIASQPTLLRVSAESTSHKLFYNPASETLILERRNLLGPHPLPTRLFVRHKDAAAYEQVGDPGPRMSYESPVTCEKRPIVLFNSKEWEQAGRPDWAGVYAFNLQTKELSVCIPKGSLAFQEPHVRSWILELFFYPMTARNCMRTSRSKRRFQADAMSTTT
jgi:hypothetical protein